MLLIATVLTHNDILYTIQKYILDINLQQSLFKNHYHYRDE